MFKNTASQKVRFFAYNSTTNAPVSGDAANITAYVSKDYGAVTVLTDTSATEEDATNAKGFYLFDLTQAETNADTLGFSAKSATANIVVVAVPAVVYTRPPNFSTTSIDSNGRLDIIKVAGTTQTAGDIIGDTNDIQTRLPAALVGGRIDANVGAISSDATAADNAEAFFDGTGYAGTNNVIPTVTTLTNLPAITAGWLTATGIAADAITAAKLAADVTTELQSGLATAASIAALNNLSAAQVNTEVDTALADVGLTTTITGRIDAAVSSRLATAGYTAPLDAAGTRTAVGLASANLDTQLDALPTNAELSTALAAADDAILAEVALVKAKTDSLTFTVAGQVDANIQYVNDIQVTGDGETGTEWGPV